MDSVRQSVPAVTPPVSPAAAASFAADETACFHCGTPCPDGTQAFEGRAFCCAGCRTVYQVIRDNGLGHFYDLGRQAGIRVGQPEPAGRFAYLDDPLVRDRLIDFADEVTSRVTFQVPAIHCIACVWLLENLFRLHPGIGRSQVNFPRKEVAITFAHGQLRLSELAALLAGLGYEPAFHLATTEGRAATPHRRGLWLRVGVAGFAFGNIMLFSIPAYLGLAAAGDPALQRLFGGLSLLLATPVLLFSASDYWRSAWQCLRQRMLTIDLPIAAGLAAIYGQSLYEILAGRGEGYLDSLTGLIFFLLCGKVFQQKTYDRLAFDRDYRSFFPLSVRRRTDAGEETVPLARVRVGDRLVLRHGELIPADARLLRGEARVDYSFVTGEAEPVARAPGEHLYAGGQQAGGAIEVEVVKPVSQSYLTSLWEHELFAKVRGDSLNNLTNRFSRRFTLTVAAVAVLAAVFWHLRGDGPRALKAFTSVMIVACPCALALAAPFALGTAQRLLGRRQIFLRSPQVTETLARVNAIVFDKTGTLTSAGAGALTFNGTPLSAAEQARLRALTRHSTHPYARRIQTFLAEPPAGEHAELVDFRETPGRGIEGRVAGQELLLLGSAAWLEQRGVRVPADAASRGASVHLAVAGRHRGAFRLGHTLRPEAGRMLARLAGGYELALLTGDHARERERFATLFGPDARLRFHQSPEGKLEFIRELQDAGRTVMMVGDGLNDSGALRQSDAGVAVVENVGTFTPASDVILEANAVDRLPAVLNFGRLTVRIVWMSFALSSVYNAVGLAVAAQGLLSPLICAVLMPLSSATVVGFACGATHWAARHAGLTADPGEGGRP